MSQNLPYVILIGLPLVAAPIVYLLGRLSVRKDQTWGLTFARLFTIVILLLEAVALFFTTRTALTQGSVAIEIGNISLLFDGVGLLLAMVVVVLGLFVAIFSTKYMEDENGEEKFYALLLITIGSIVGLAATFDLFNLWVWFEVMAVSTYFLVAFYNNQAASLEAGVKIPCPIRCGFDAGAFWHRVDLFAGGFGFDADDLPGAHR